LAQVFSIGHNWNKLTEESYKRFKFRTPPEDLADRGLGADSTATIATTLGEYPWREDTLALWQVITSYVKDYIKLYFSNPNTILADPELQEWYRCKCDWRVLFRRQSLTVWSSRL
jgi:hypothetical protein